MLLFCVFGCVCISKFALVWESCLSIFSFIDSLQFRPCTPDVLYPEMCVGKFLVRHLDVYACLPLCFPRGREIYRFLRLIAKHNTPEIARCVTLKRRHLSFDGFAENKNGGQFGTSKYGNKRNIESRYGNKRIATPRRNKMAAASRTTSSSFHNMPHRNGTFVASHGASAAAEVSPDLHLKMSKKIAQLTKVIYALNTKNDEHESIVENLKTSHEEEVQQLMAETTEKINYFKSKLNVVSEQKQTLELLESHLTREKLQRREAMSEFEKFKHENERKEANLRSDYSEKILSMSKELLSSKRQFEDRLKEFQEMRKRLEEDRDKAVDDLSRKHHEELDQLMKAHRVRYDEVVKEKRKLEEKHKKSLAQLQSSGENSEEERRKIESEYQEKVQKLQAFYEKELAALRAVEQNSKDSQVKELEEREKTLKLDWARQERVFKDRISELLNQLSDGEQDMSVLRTQVRELESQLSGRDLDFSAHAKELEISRREAAKALSSLREVQNELNISSKRCQDQGQEISRQSSEYIFPSRQIIKYFHKSSKLS